MDKQQVEKYLRMYPEIDEEIERLQGNLEYYKSEKEKYRKKLMPEDEKKSMLDTMCDAYKETLVELQDIMVAKRAIERALNAATPLQRTIIKFRFWQKKRVLWAEVAEEINYHAKHIERAYGEFVKLVT
ncbi:MAG: hypothetical protein WC373_05655 [Smithella sp.]|jgi:CHASE3 domain sensor protein